MITSIAKQPSLQHATENQWQQMGRLCHLLARHGRHDLGNLVFASEMVSSPQRQSRSDKPIETRESLDEQSRQGMINTQELILLSQASNPAAYDGTRTQSLWQIAETAILNRAAQGVPEISVMQEALEYDQVHAMGKMLHAAVSVFFFQWAPGSHAHDAASRLTIRRYTDRVTFSFPADDVESVASFARRLSAANDPVETVLRDLAGITTTELALWVARFIVQLHGGIVTCEVNDPDLALRITLPLIPSR